MATIKQIIGKVSPRNHATNGGELLKKYGSIDKIPADEVKPKPLAEHKLVYDSSTETLEPLYFFILDLMNDKGFAPEKLVDSFTSSPGSGHFSELGQKATMMQQQGAKILGDVNTVLRSVLNIIYDLKEFRIRLQHYDDLNSGKDKEAATLALKQIWMDKVDMQKGNSSIKAMALGQAGFQTLINAFLAVKEPKDVDNLDLNEMVKRILKPRVLEFNSWIKESERELRKRYELEKTYLRSQVNSMKLYSRWAKPYLKAAQKLEMKESNNPALVTVFNTILLELTLLGKSELNPKKAALSGDLPADFSNEKFLRTLKRKYYSCVLVDFSFRGIPQRAGQQYHYAFGGLADVTFSAFALNQDEIDLFNKELKKSEVEDVLKLIEGTTEESMKQLQEDISFFLEDKTKDEKQKPKDQSNPFLALIGAYDKKSKSSESKKIIPENFIEKEHLRKLAGEKASDSIFDLFDTYKKGHGMATFT